MSVQYRMNYEGDDSPRQIGTEIVAATAPRGQAEKTTRRRRRIPSSVQTAITVVICGCVFFAAVRFSPVGWRPQDFTGEYIGDVAGEVKENEGAIDGEVQAYVNGVRAAYEQRNAQYGRIVEGYLEAYKSSLAINLQQADAANRLRGAYVERQMGQAMQSSGSNVGIANAAEGLGQLQNWLTPGSGDATLAEAERQRRIAADRLQNTTIESASIDLAGLVNQLPSEDALRQRIDALPPIALPPEPAFMRERN
jgi:hypothetical protein